MKKTQKKVLGFSGLALVAAMTAFAVTLPSPAGAINNTSVTDTLQVRVVGGAPDVNILEPAENKKVGKAHQDLVLSYENLDKVVVSLKFTAESGTTYEIENYRTLDGLNYAAGEQTIDLDFSRYGYGTYDITVKGYGADSVPDEDRVQLVYVASVTNVEEKEDGSIDVDVDYDGDEIGRIDVSLRPEGGNPIWSGSITPPNKDINIPLKDLEAGDYEIVVDTYDKNGNFIDQEIVKYHVPGVTITEKDDGSIDIEVDTDGEGEIGKIVIDVKPSGDDNTVWTGTVTPPETGTNIPFDEFAKESGDYDIIVKIYDKDGNLIKTTTVKYHYESVNVPNTGAFFKNLNIAKEDYLITGVIIFFVLAVVALGVVSRGRKDKKSRK